MVLLDQFANPIKPAVLTTPVAAADFFGLRPAIIETPFSGLDPAILGEAMAAADRGDSLAWQALAELIEERDAHYQGVLGTRKRSVAQLPITVDPVSDAPEHKRHAEWVEDWLRLGLIEQHAEDFLDGIGKGWSVHELDWTLEPGFNRITALHWRPQRWFEVSYQDGETILVRENNAVPAPASVPDGPVQAGFVPMPALKFCVHRHKSWSGLTMRSGLARTAAFLVMAKHFTSRDWGLFVQSYGMPLRIGKYGLGASDEDRRVLKRAVFDLYGAGAAIIPESMLVEFIEPKHGAGSNDIHQRRCEWIDSQLSKLVLGQTGTSDSKQGAHASGSVHRLVQEDIERSDARLLTQTINTQLIQPMIALTFGPQKMGQYPRVRIGRPDEEPIEAITAAVQWMGPQGLTLRATEVRQRLGFTDPDEDDTDIIGGRTPAAPPARAAHVLPAQDRPDETIPPTVPAPSGDSAPDNTTSGKVSLHAQLGQVLIRHTRDNGPGLVSALSASAARECAEGFAALCKPAQEAYERAGSLEAFRAELEALKLPEDQLAEAMANAILVSELAGEAMILDQMQRDG